MTPPPAELLRVLGRTYDFIVIDAGNTNIVFAVWNGEEWIGSWRIRTDPQRTSDEYAVWLLTLLAAFVAPHVVNEGVITANFGRVTLGSAKAFTLDLYGDRLIQLAPGDSIASEIKDVATKQTLKDLVSNSGKLSAKIDCSSYAPKDVA